MDISEFRPVVKSKKKNKTRLDSILDKVTGYFKGIMSLVVVCFALYLLVIPFVLMAAFSESSSDYKSREQQNVKYMLKAEGFNDREASQGADAIVRFHNVNN
jgi:hypothetical protein